MKKYLITLFFMVVFLPLAVDLPVGRMDAFAQVQYSVPETSPNAFLIKRFRLKFTGDIVESLLSVTLQAELNNKPVPEYDDSEELINVNSIALLDAKATFNFNPIRLTVGRFLTPFDHYTPISLFNLNTLDYPMIDLDYSPSRQIGIELLMTLSAMDFWFCVLNGNEKNNYEETDSEKSYIFRLDIKPVKGITAGFSEYIDNYFLDEAYVKNTKSNVFVSVKENNYFFITQLSYIEAGGETGVTVYSYGYFFNLSFYLGQFEITGRYEFIDKDSNKPGEVKTRFTGGVNYTIVPNKAQAGISYFINGETVEIANNQLLFQLQFTL